MTEEEYVQRVHEQVDTYERTIQAIVCLDSALRYDDQLRNYPVGSKSFQGRLMDTSVQNAVSPNIKVQPDLVVQLNSSAGIVCEVKLTASNDRDFQAAHKQLTKYDDNLRGWDTPDETIKNHDLCLIVDHIHTKAAVDFFENVTYVRPFVLLTMIREDEARVQVAFENRIGDFSDSRLRDKFPKTKVVGVPLHKLQDKWGAAKFYDARPECVEYTMLQLWYLYFPEELDTRKLVRGDREVIQKRVSPKRGAEFLQGPYALFACEGERQPEVPKPAWIKEALDKFVAIGRAQRDQREHNTYWVEYSRQARKANLEGFARQVYKKEHPKKRAPSAEAAKKQLLLFN